METPQDQRWARMFAEHGTLMASLVKWTILAATVGVLAGAGTAIFLRLLDWGITTMVGVPWRLLWLPVGFVIAHLLVRFLAPEAEGHGTDKVIEAVHQRSGRIALLVAPVKLAATVVTIAVGVLFLVPSIPPGAGTLGIGLILLVLNIARTFSRIPVNRFTLTFGLIAVLLGGGARLALYPPQARDSRACAWARL